MVRFTTATALATSALAGLSTAVEYVHVDGPYFTGNTTGKRFNIIGATYQPGGQSSMTSKADPLSDPNACLRDSILMQLLGINTIRVYNLAANVDHNQCASIYNAAGIYMIIDVNSPLTGQYIDRSDPKSTYTLDYLKHVVTILHNFWGYPNVMAFFSGNEIINEDSAKEAPAYIRAVTRDLKEYAKNHSPRAVPIGYSAADVADTRSDTYHYLSCKLDDSPLSSVDIFGMNVYEWCGNSNYDEAGYSGLVTLFKDSSIPVFFSEYGCNTQRPRPFTEVGALYGKNMTGLSGGLAYEYSEETDKYGLVKIKSSNELQLLADYSNLQDQLAKIDRSIATSAGKSSASATKCAASLMSGSNFPTAWDIPPRPSGADDLISNGLDTASFSVGSLVSVTATAMPAKVTDANGKEMSNLSLVKMGCADANYPGLVSTYTAPAETCAYATTTPVSGNGSGGKSGASSVVGGPELRTIAAIGATLAGILGGILLM